MLAAVLALLTAVGGAVVYMDRSNPPPAFRPRMVRPAGRGTATGPRDLQGKRCAPTIFFQTAPPLEVPFRIRISPVELPLTGWFLEPDQRGVVRLGPLGIEDSYEMTFLGARATGGARPSEDAHRVVLKGGELHGWMAGPPPPPAREVPEGYRSVLVTDPNGWPVVLANITLEDGRERSFQTAPGGRALLPVLASGARCTVEPHSDEHALKPLATTLHPETSILTLGWAGRAKVSVEVVGEPGGPPEVFVFREPGFLPSVRLPPDGVVPYGRYRVCARSGPAVTPMRRIDVQEPELTLDFEEWRPSVVRMRVLGPGGGPVKGLTIGLSERSWRLAQLPRATSTQVPWQSFVRGHRFPPWAVTVMGRTDGEGMVVFRGVPPGTYVTVPVDSRYQLDLLVTVPERLPEGRLELGPVEVEPASGALAVSLEGVGPDIPGLAMDVRTAFTSFERLRMGGRSSLKLTGLAQGVYSVRLLGRESREGRPRWLSPWTNVHVVPGGEVGVVLEPR